MHKSIEINKNHIISPNGVYTGSVYGSLYSDIKSKISLYDKAKIDIIFVTHKS